MLHPTKRNDNLSQRNLHYCYFDSIKVMLHHSLQGIVLV